MRVFLILLILASSFQLFSQSKAENDSLLKVSIDWLEVNLENNYQNTTSGEWWNNNVFINRTSWDINVKNSSSDVPNGVDKNVYYDRKLNLIHLDVASTKIISMKRDKGRMARGKAVQVNVIGNEKRIQKSFNGKESFKEFFLQFSFPASVDTLFNKAEVCKDHLKVAIDLSARVYTSNTAAETAGILFSSVSGKYMGTNGIVCEVEELFRHTLEFKFLRDGELFKKSIISYDIANDHYSYWMVNQAGSSHHSLNQEEGETISLSADSKKFQFSLQGINHFNLNVDQVSTDYAKIGF